MLSNILPLAIVPGPKALKDYNSFLQPLVDEFKQLSLGNWAFDAFSNETFKLCAYPISFHGDMVATKHVMDFKSLNGMWNLTSNAKGAWAFELHQGEMHDALSGRSPSVGLTLPPGEPLLWQTSLVL